jgi:hypothetical protein
MARLQFEKIYQIERADAKSYRISAEEGINR